MDPLTRSQYEEQQMRVQQRQQELMQLNRASDNYPHRGSQYQGQPPRHMRGASADRR